MSPMSMQEDQEHNDHGQAHVEDDPDTISEAEKSNLDRHKYGTGCYHKRPYVCEDCNKRFRDKDLGGHKQGGRCVK